MVTEDDLQNDLVHANHILFSEGVLDAFGHVSARDTADPTKFYLARSMAPALVQRGDIQCYDLQGEPLRADSPPSYLERFIHSAIYQARPDVLAVVHSHSPSVIPFGVTGQALRPLYHMSSFLSCGCGQFEISDKNGETDMLIRNPELGAQLAECLGQGSLVLMRGHGSVVVGPSLRVAVFRAIYSEVNAKLQAQAAQLGTIRFLSDAEATLADAANQGQVGRAWELWKSNVAFSD